MVTIRLANPTDLEQLPALFQRTMARKVSPREIDWRFLENPALDGKVWNYVALDGDGVLVGHSAFIPMWYSCGGKTYLGALSAGSMVVKEHGGLFVKLYRELERCVAKRGVDFFFAFPNRMSAPFFLKMFGYNQHHLAYLSADLWQDQCQAVTGCDTESREIVVNACAPSFFSWRVSENPLYTYTIHAVGHIRIVTKSYGVDGLDLLAILPGGEREEGRKNQDMINFTEDTAHLLDDVGVEICKQLRLGTDKKRAYLYSTHAPDTQALKVRGWQEESTPNRLVIKTINSELAEKSFSFQMIDSDVF